MNKQAFIAVVRKSFAELAIGVTACGAGYMFLVEPMEKKLAHARGDAETLRQSIHTLRSTPAATGNSVKVAGQARRLMTSIEERSEPVRHHTKMLQAVMNLADRTNMRVDQFNPVAPRGPRLPKAGAVPAPAAAGNTVPPAGVGPSGLPAGNQTFPGTAGAPAARPDPKLEFRSAYSIALKGSFNDAVAFVRAVQQDIGFTCIKSVVISPANGATPNHVTVALETEHIGLETKGMVTAAPVGEAKP